MVEGASRATMVLLPKQVHLQKEVGAGDGVSISDWVWGREHVLAARESERKAKKVRTARRYRCMAGCGE